MVHNFNFFLIESSEQNSQNRNSDIQNSRFFDFDENGECIFTGPDPQIISDLVSDFLSGLNLLSSKEIKDIQITGSTVNPEESNFPELDIIVIFDLNNFDSDERDRIKKSVEKYRIGWNIKNKAKISNIPVDIDVHPEGDHHSDSGLYSLKKNVWISKPNIPDSDVDHRDVYKKYSRFSSEIDRVCFLLENGFFSQFSKRDLIDHLKYLAERVSYMKQNKPTDPNIPHIGYLCYQKLRKEGYIKKLVGALVDYSSFLKNSE